MKYVSRTATEYLDPDDSSVPHSHPLSDLRSERAYVLLGDPGAGKTTAFKHEAEAVGAQYATAREFVRGDLDGTLNTEDTVLFIDGLDEMRAGGGDPRSPLDRIVVRLRQLAWRRFRLSCRPHDWGLTDADALQSLLDGAALPVLLLDPLDSTGIRDVLSGLSEAQTVDTTDFLRQAMDRGLYGLLGNPQLLQLLVRVVAKGKWPESQAELFEDACRQLVWEQNPEHVDAARRRDASELGTERLLNAAGRLSALFLLTDARAICRSSMETRNDDLALNEVEGGDPDALSRVLATKLFTAQAKGRFVPVHAQIAEYLGARFLRNVIEGHIGGQGGVPSARVLSLMTGHDGGIVSGLRGLAAWLAALCGEPRKVLVSADPIGVLTYGDVGRFGDDDLATLFRALEGRARQLSRRAWPMSALGSMIRPSTIKMLRAYITDNDRSDAKQAAVDMLVRGIPRATSAPWARHEHSSPVARPFIEELLHLVRDPTWWPRVRNAGIDAALHVVEESGEGDDLVDELLQEVKEGQIHDPGNELRGKLLAALYPNRIPPEQVWDYVPNTANRSLIGHDFMFWAKRIEESTPSTDLPVLMEGLHDNSTRLLAVLGKSRIELLVNRILVRTLDEHGETTPVSRLSKWIEVAVRTRSPDGRRRNTPESHRLMSWYAAYPAISRACLLEFMKRNAHKERLHRIAWPYRREVTGDPPPPGLAGWCLDHAIELVDSYAPAAQLLLAWAFRLQRRDPDFDHWVTCAVVRLQGLPELRDRLAHLAKLLASEADETETGQTKWRDQEAAAAPECRRRKKQQYIAHVGKQANSLAAGSCNPALLDGLARTYFGFDSGHMAPDPTDALRDSLDSDEDLVSATLSGFTRVLERDDLPDLEEVVRLDENGRPSRFALPVLAGLAEGDRTGRGGYRKLTEDGIRRAVGFYYLSPRPTVRGLRPGWYRRADVPAWYNELVRSHPKVVAEGLVAVHGSLIRRKMHCEEHLASLAWESKYRELARLAAPPLLRAFPTRCTRPQILALRHLLWASVRLMPDELASWVATKLARSGMDVAQRVLWLGAGMLVSPEQYLAAAMDFIREGKTTRVQHLISFVVPEPPLPSFSMEWSTEHLATAVRGIGARIAPWRPPGGNELKAHLMTPADEAATKAQRLLSAWLEGLARQPEAKATDALESLADAPELAAWQEKIRDARDQQVVLRRAHEYQIPTVDQVQHVLRDAEPASAADLCALTVDRLQELADEIRNGNTDDWRQYWNEGRRRRGVKPKHGDSWEPKHEDSCRDALLSDLKHVLPPGVDAQPEGQYAEDKRADIRVAYGGHAIPVEIKKNAHRRLWSAINDQLIDQYVRAPESGGFGVYLVLWFGVRHTRVVPPTGSFPKTPAALRERLQEQLAPDKRGTIKVVVVDVSRPLTPPGAESPPPSAARHASPAS